MRGSELLLRKIDDRALFRRSQFHAAIPRDGPAGGGWVPRWPWLLSVSIGSSKCLLWKSVLWGLDFAATHRVRL